MIIKCGVYEVEIGVTILYRVTDQGGSIKIAKGRVMAVNESKELGIRCWEQGALFFAPPHEFELTLEAAVRKAERLLEEMKTP